MSERDTFATTYAVPRETMARLDRYADLLIEWQGRMNLVGRSTLDAIWTRHFADSAQLAALSGDSSASTNWLDIGSGAGFPALVLALLLPGRFHLVESTAKKCLFLQTVIDELGLDDRVTTHAVRIESLAAVGADLITARACAALPQLFDWGLRHGRQATWLLLKGQSVADEVAAARPRFTFDCELIPSRTDERARIVVARNVRRSGA